jgi:hypothetical protein
VHASHPKAKEETRVVHDDAQDVITKKNINDNSSCKKIEPAVPASRLKKETSSSTHISARAARDGDHEAKGRREGFVHQVQAGSGSSRASSIKDKLNVTGAAAGVLRNDARGVTRTKQEASRSIQTTATKSIPPIRLTAPAANHQDHFAPQNVLRAAIAVALQARERRQQNVYRQQREEARRELDKVVRTVFFDDPYITVEDAFKF